jgi:hypothetical protein
MTEVPILLDEKPATAATVGKTDMPEEEQEKEIYSGSDFTGENFRSTAYDVNIGDDNNPV